MHHSPVSEGSLAVPESGAVFHYSVHSASLRGALQSEGCLCRGVLGSQWERWLQRYSASGCLGVTVTLCLVPARKLILYHFVFLVQRQELALEAAKFSVPKQSLF